MSLARPGGPFGPRFERFDAGAVRSFLRLFGLALIVDVATELVAGVWHVHTGRLYPWRHLGILPLYPPSVLAVEWTLRAGAGLALALAAPHKRVVEVAVRVAALVLFAAVLERYSNHGVLLFLIAFYLALASPDVASPAFEEIPHPALALVRVQLVLVYLFSGINKLTHNFGSGAALTNLLGDALPPGSAGLLSWLVMTSELALPLVLLRWPRLGLAGVVAMHAVFATRVPGVASFGLAMIAIARLFLPTPRAMPR